MVNPTLATTGIGALGAVAKGFVSGQVWIGGHIYDGNAVSSGVEWKVLPDQFLSLGMGWAQPSASTYGRGVDDEYVFEASYKIQLVPNFSLTPDLQYIRNPAKNTNENSVWVGGLRAILTL